MSPTFTIGQLASAAEIPAATIRYYEKIGLLASPSRSGSNYRQYGNDDLDRLTFVRRARDIGFTIDQVRSLLSFSDQQNGDCCTVTALTENHLAVVEQKIADLLLLKDRLTSLLASCKGGLVSDCRIIDALTPRQ
ncbi:HTH-type transcriptional regulator HmrR [Janthinobacterium sp. HH106]|uniref:MerR family transcriptional regulator n=1 Tax=unclassified Janthinobacterium TaxID=2610881 RepID=UPI000873B4C8|nr:MULTISPECIES: helix-turn-helix domain-containing protein [unclassified Janthinobacterium]OEZ90499.1 HTH-type transcriptional regulator HmrR [Janthinobacterium sp. HH106]